MRFMNHSTGQFGSPVSSLVLHLPATSPAQPPRSCLLGFCRTQRVWGRGAGRDGTFFSPRSGASGCRWPRSRGSAAAPRALSGSPGPAPVLPAEHMAVKTIHWRARICIYTHKYMCVCMYLAPDRDPATFAVLLQHPFFFIKPQMI